MNEQERAAMQQALEALELVVVDVKTTPTAYEAQRQAITALRAALAQEQATGSWHDGVLEGQLRERERWLAQQPEPVQEPVATPWKAMYELAIEQRTKAHAQRDALLEALDQCLNGTLIGGHTHNDNGLEVLAERCGSPHVATELRRLAGIARATIRTLGERK